MADEASTTDESTTETPEAPSTVPPTEKTTEEKSSSKTYDEDYVKRLRSESAGYRTERNTLREEIESLKGQLGELKTGSEGTSARVTDLERENAKLAVALETGLPKELVPRLVGNTPEELAADAEKLLAFVNPAGGTAPRPNFDGGNRQSLKAPDLATQITEAEKAGDVKLSMALKARMALENRDKLGTNGAMSPFPPRT